MMLKPRTLKKLITLLQSPGFRPVNIVGAILMIVAVDYPFYTKSSKKIEWRVVKAENGVTATVRLSDSSLIELNAGTVLRYPETFDKRKREVYIEGEAFITAAPNANQPLIVHTKQASINVLGTSFNVCTYEGKFCAALVSGAILVSTSCGQTIKLTPGYSASLLPKSDQLVVASFKENEMTGWIEGKYKFENEALTDICRVIERTYNIKIAFDTPPRLIHFTGAMNRHKPFTVILKKLSAISRMEYYRDDNGTIHWK